MPVGYRLERTRGHDETCLSRHFFIPDTQISPGCDTSHIDWCAQALVDYMPDVIVVIGDWWDFASLNGHAEKGSKELEGTRYKDDLDVGNDAFRRLVAPMEKERTRRKVGHRTAWNPRKIFCLGNHENRADRIAQNDPKWQGIIGSHQCETLDFERYGFLEIVEVDGIAYSHYFANTHGSRPIGGNIDNRLNKIGRSFSAGHEQGILYGLRPFPGNITRQGLVCGSFYQHNMNYRGPQGRNEWRGIIIKNECENGCYDIMPLSLRYLQKKYG